MAIATFDTRIDPDRVVVAVTGEIDMSVKEQFEQVLTAAVRAAQGGCLVIDPSQVGYLDASGIHVLLTGKRFAGDARATCLQ